MMTTLADLISRADHDRLAELAEIVVALMREPGSPANPGREPLRLSPPLLVRSWCPPAPVGRSWCLVPGVPARGQGRRVPRALDGAVLCSRRRRRPPAGRPARS